MADTEVIEAIGIMMVPGYLLLSGDRLKSIHMSDDRWTEVNMFVTDVRVWHEKETGEKFITISTDITDEMTYKGNTWFLVEV